MGITARRGGEEAGVLVVLVGAGAGVLLLSGSPSSLQPPSCLAGVEPSGLPDGRGVIMTGNGPLRRCHLACGGPFVPCAAPAFLGPLLPAAAAIAGPARHTPAATARLAGSVPVHTGDLPAATAFPPFPLRRRTAASPRGPPVPAHHPAGRGGGSSSFACSSGASPRGALQWPLCSPDVGNRRGGARKHRPPSTQRTSAAICWTFGATEATP
mmetsp:Transcript_22901/g.63572  ORF Transcript_22901/g.63572 Transcript_22901/m.63572 type:complete len:212 (+) Transcript_22901:432-1067(+)